MLIITLHIVENMSLKVRKEFKNQKIDTGVSSAFGDLFDWWNDMILSGYTEYHQSQSGER